LFLSGFGRVLGTIVKVKVDQQSIKNMLIFS